MTNTALPPEEVVPLKRHWIRDWRVWFAAAITIVCLWWSMRGVPLDEVLAAMGRADLLLLVGLSVPAYVAAVLFRALRWRHLTNPVAVMPRGILYTATSIGFMVNNLVPLRIGEVVRAWVLARDQRVSTSSMLGTVALERVLDIVSVLLLALFALSWAGAESYEGGILLEGAFLMIPVAVLALAGIVALRLWPEFVARTARFVLRPLPERIGVGAEGLLRRFSDGLGALRGGSHLFWIVLHSLLIWMVFSTIPVVAGIEAFGIDLGKPEEVLVLSWIVLAVVGVAVAIPSAPGFFGPYQLAFKAVLVRFGVDPATALAAGLLVWFVFWVTLTLHGFLVLRLGGISFEDLTRSPSKDSDSDRR